MKHRISCLLLLTFYLFSSCTEDYGIPVMDNSRILVVNGCITNDEGPYRIQLFENTSIANSNRADVAPVTGARLSITDNIGNTNELKPLWKERVAEVQTVGYYDDDGIPHYFRQSYLLMPNYKGGYDSLLFDASFKPENAVGVYYTTSTRGVAGRSYTLKIEYQGQYYTATDRMPGVTVIDSVTLSPSGKGIDGKGYEGFDIPHLYFAEPQGVTNYYLLTYNMSDNFWDVAEGRKQSPEKDFEEIVFNARQKLWVTWNYIAVSDRFMSPYMANYKVNDGATHISWVTGTDEGWNGLWGSADIYLASVSYKAYQYYQSLISQFYHDGGAFSSAPSTPPSNVSNGGQGFFMAVSVSQKRVSRSTGNF